jgi:hypothetical protein
MTMMIAQPAFAGAGVTELNVSEIEFVVGGCGVVGAAVGGAVGAAAGASGGAINSGVQTGSASRGTVVAGAASGAILGATAGATCNIPALVSLVASSTLGAGAAGLLARWVDGPDGTPRPR